MISVQSIVFGCLAVLPVCIIVAHLARYMRQKSPEAIREEHLIDARRNRLLSLANAEFYQSQAEMFSCRIARLTADADSDSVSHP
jgi:hypothetical protein